MNTKLSVDFGKARLRISNGEVSLYSKAAGVSSFCVALAEMRWSNLRALLAEIARFTSVANEVLPGNGISIPVGDDGWLDFWPDVLVLRTEDGDQIDAWPLGEDGSDFVPDGVIEDLFAAVAAADSPDAFATAAS